MSGGLPCWEEPEGDLPFLAEATAWRGDLHPESDEPGWPEPEPPSEYHLMKRDLEDKEK